MTTVSKYFEVSVRLLITPDSLELLSNLHINGYITCEMTIFEQESAIYLFTYITTFSH